MLGDMYRNAGHAQLTWILDEDGERMDQLLMTLKGSLLGYRWQEP